MRGKSLTCLWNFLNLAVYKRLFRVADPMNLFARVTASQRLAAHQRGKAIGQVGALLVTRGQADCSSFRITVSEFGSRAKFLDP